MIVPSVSLSIVIPTLNAAGTLPRTLSSVTDPNRDDEIVVADGGSTDTTAAVAATARARVITAPRGRGSQLAAGAAVARGTWLLFLHADTRLSPGWRRVALGFAGEPENRHRAGYFRLMLDDPAPAARRLEAAVGLRNRLLGLPYGDQGLLVARERYDAVGGFQAVPLMEDVDLVLRIGRRHMVMLEAEALTSAARYRRDGYFLRPLRNALCLSLYTLGVPPRWIRILYG